MQKKNKTLYILSCIFSAISFIGMLFCGALTYEFISAQLKNINDLGQGIALVIVVVFFVIGACITELFAVLSGVFTAINLRLPEFPKRLSSKGILIFDICAALLIVGMFVLMWAFNAQ